MTAILADDPVGMAQSDGAVGKNKRIRTLMHAAHGHLPIVYFAQAVPGDLPPPEEGALLGRYSDGPYIVPELQLADRAAPIVLILAGEVAPELEALALDADVVLATPAGAGTAIAADVVLDDDASAIAAAVALLRLIPTHALTPLRRVGAAPQAPAASLPDEGASDLGAGAIVEAICDAGSLVPFAATDDLAAGLASIDGFPLAYVIGGSDAFARPQLEIVRRVTNIAARYALPLVLGQHGAAYDEEALGTQEYRRLVAEIAASIHGMDTPKICIVTRRGQLAGDFILGGRELGIHYGVAWPEASIASGEASPFTVERAQAADGAGPWDASGLALVDDVIAPSETRDRLAAMLELTAEMRALPPVLDDRKGRIVYR